MSDADEELDELGADDGDVNGEASPPPIPPQSTSEEVMPVLKYHRMKAHVETVQRVGGRDTQITALCMHPRCLIVGTSTGTVHLLDYQDKGHELGLIRAAAHGGRQIRCFSTDDTGEYLASCSDAGVVVVTSLTFPAQTLSSSSSFLSPSLTRATATFKTDRKEEEIAETVKAGGGAVAATKLSFPSEAPQATAVLKQDGIEPVSTTSQSTGDTGCDRGGQVVIGSEQVFRVSKQPLLAVHLDPGYRRISEKAFVTGGQEGRLVLGRKGFFSSYREETLHENEGPITAIAWRGSLVAWANEEGVKVLDVEGEERICFLARPEIEGRSTDLRCSLLWESETSLLIGWFDTFMVLQIKARAPGTTPERLPPTSAASSSPASSSSSASSSSPSRPSSAQRGSRVGEMTVRWKADCVISGLWPFDVDSVALLGYVSLVEGEAGEGEGGVQSLERGMERLTTSSQGTTDSDQDPGPGQPPSSKVVCRAELQLRSRREGRLFSGDILPVHGEERVRDSLGFLFASSFGLTCRRVPGPGLWRLPRGLGRAGGLIAKAGAAHAGSQGGSKDANSAGCHLATRGLGDGGGADSSHGPGKGQDLSASSPALDTGESFMPVMLIAGPEDLLVARVRGVEDRILWVLQKGAMGAAIELALLNRHLLTHQRFHALATSYLEVLLAQGAYGRAAAECPRLLGEEASSWERWIYTFAARRRLASLAPFIPLESPRLSRSTYEMVLNHFLDCDREAFLSTIKKWGTQQQKFGRGARDEGGMEGGSGGLYDLEDLSKRVTNIVAQAPDSLLLQAHAYLLQRQGRFAASLAVYWDLFRLLSAAARRRSSPRGSAAGDMETRKHLFSPVFSMIEEHNFFDAAAERVSLLVKMDRSKAADLLVRYVDRLPVASVVRQLQLEERGGEGEGAVPSTALAGHPQSSRASASPSLVLWYLDLLFRRLPDHYNHPEFAQFHVLQVELYAAAAPPFRPAPDRSHTNAKDEDTVKIKDSGAHGSGENASDEEDGVAEPAYTSDLLSFLMWSNHVRLETALAACERRQPPLYDEIVYILSRIGHNKEALRLLLVEIRSVRRAIEFVDRHDKGLWRELTAHSLQHPRFLAGLLRHAGNYNVDLARSLVEDIPDAMRIRGLQPKLLNIVASYRFERTLHEESRRVAEHDYVAATRRFHHAQRRAVRVDIPQSRCQGCLEPFAGPPPAKPPPDLPPRAPESVDVRELHVFSCKHFYHDICCLAVERHGSAREAGKEGGKTVGRQSPRLHERSYYNFYCQQCRDQAQYDLAEGKVGGKRGGMKPPRAGNSAAIKT